MTYDTIAAVDYSGAESLAAQRKHIYLTTIENKKSVTEIVSGISRDECREQIQSLLHKAHKNKKYCLIGFDFSFWFPSGFFKQLYKQRLKSWRDGLRTVTAGAKNIPALGENPRNWAERINDIFKREYRVDGGPFWGAGFSQKTKPVFPFDTLGFSPLRLVEERLPKMKSIFQIGGIGSVGLQALHGICQLHKLLDFCRFENIPLHVWPFDDWQPAPARHLICEIYPGLYNRGPKGDLEDSLASARWFANHTRDNLLAEEFNPQLTGTERKRSQMEGWVPGIF